MIIMDIIMGAIKKSAELGRKKSMIFLTFAENLKTWIPPSHNSLYFKLLTI